MKLTLLLSLLCVQGAVGHLCIDTGDDCEKRASATECRTPDFEQSCCQSCSALEATSKKEESKKDDGSPGIVSIISGYVFQLLSVLTLGVCVLALVFFAQWVSKLQPGGDVKARLKKGGGGKGRK